MNPARVRGDGGHKQRAEPKDVPGSLGAVPLSWGPHRPLEAGRGAGQELGPPDPQVNKQMDGTTWSPSSAPTRHAGWL